MYFVLGLEDGVGRVEKGTITEVYPDDTPIGDVVSGDAPVTDSKYVGTRPQATDLVQMVTAGGRTIVKSSLFEVQKEVQSSHPAGDVSVGNHL